MKPHNQPVVLRSIPLSVHSEVCAIFHMPSVRFIFSSNGGDQNPRHLRDPETQLAASQLRFTRERMQEACRKITRSQPSAPVPQMKHCDMKHDIGLNFQVWDYKGRSQWKGRKMDPAVIQFKRWRIKITRASLERQVTAEVGTSKYVFLHASPPFIVQRRTKVVKIKLQWKVRWDDNQYQHLHSRLPKSFLKVLEVRQTLETSHLPGRP